MLVLVNFIAVSTIVAVLAFLGLRIRKISSDAKTLGTKLDDGLKSVGDRLDTSISTVQQNIQDNVSKLTTGFQTGISNLQSNIQKDVSRLDTKDAEIINTTNTNQQALQTTLTNIQKEVSNVDMRKGGNITGDIDVSGTTKTSTLKLGDKWSLSGKGDAHGNDDWLRFFNKDGKDYYGGVAAGKLWSGGPVYVGGDLSVSGTTTVGGVVGLQDKQLRLRGLGDPNHFVGYSGESDGPRIQGYQGGQLGVVQDGKGKKTPLWWYKDGVKMWGNIEVNGPIEVNGSTKTSSLKLGDKWSLSGVGDGHANDDWLRIMGKDGGDYYGGVAAGKLWSGSDVYTKDLRANNQICINNTCVNETQLKKLLV